MRLQNGAFVMMDVVLMQGPFRTISPKYAAMIRLRFRDFIMMKWPPEVVNFIGRLGSERVVAGSPDGSDRLALALAGSLILARSDWQRLALAGWPAVADWLRLVISGWLWLALGGSGRLC